MGINRVGVIINAIFSFVLALSLLGFGIWFIITAGNEAYARSDTVKGPPTSLVVITGSIGIVLALILITAGIGQLLLKGWSRILGLINSGLLLLYVIPAFLMAFMMMGSDYVKPFIALGFSWPISPWLVLIIALIVLLFAAWNFIYLLLPATTEKFRGGVPYNPTVINNNTFVSNRTVQPPTETKLPAPTSNGATIQQGGGKKVERTKLMGEEPQTNAWLIITRGRQEGREFRLKNTSNLGRHQSNCDVVLTDEMASTQHACIKMEGKQFFLHDLASSNGTFLNGRRIERREMLQDGDKIKIGETVLVFKRT
jgi:hypothetical protein